MQKYVDKQQDRIAEGAVQMVAGCVANNVQNLLEAIRGKAIMALCQAESPDATQAHMTQLVEFVDQSSSIVDYLTQFTQTRQCRKQLVDLNGIVKTVIEHAVNQMNDVVLDVNLFDCPIPVAVDKEKINRAVTALMDNAYQALPRGKGTIIVATNIVKMMNGSCDLYGLPSGKYARLTITDNGVGIEKDVLPHVFKAFYSSGNQRHSARNGLGLTLARNIVKHHGGVIDIWSTAGRGSAFSIFLPLEHRAEEKNGTHALGTSSSFQP
ncbi:ATP-binding protein [Desulfobacter curvatus]|uniref:ATP-binding protein n=1 Tax=Desulfobacter curvatus TaxID=2290 RepID=UPI000362A20D|nr:ATP-binding protein [Desulfobacter curvatus]